MMRKLTRRSYNRKLVVFGLAIFMATAMISTGFAAWVMSTVTKGEADATVTVATLSDASMTVTVDQWNGSEWTGDKLSFDAPATDLAGRVQYLAVEGESGEALTMVVSGKVTNSQMLGKLTMTFLLPKTLSDAIDDNYIAVKGSAGVDYAIDENPETEQKTVTLVYDVAGAGAKQFTYTAPEASAQDKTATFTYTLEFVWGSAFGGVNPSLYYDADGATVSDEDMTAAMEAFHQTMTGADTKASYTGNIHIVVSADVKAA